MKTFALAFLLASTSAVAGTDEMVAQCQEVMRCGACQVASSPPAKGAMKSISFVDASGVPQFRQVPAADYEYIRSTGYAKTKAGKFLMCERVRSVMKKPDSVRAMGARAMFSATWQKQTYCP